MGSEMCIRDRACQQQPSEGVRLKETHRAGRGGDALWCLLRFPSVRWAWRIMTKKVEERVDNLSTCKSRGRSAVTSACFSGVGVKASPDV